MGLVSIGYGIYLWGSKLIWLKNLCTMIKFKAIGGQGFF